LSLLSRRNWEPWQASKNACTRRRPLDREAPLVMPDVRRIEEKGRRSVPNTITPQELENLHLPELGRRLSLKRAGWIQPTSARNSCEVLVDDITTCVLYCEIVDGRAMKFGTSG
jgi:hypothetical protein